MKTTITESQLKRIILESAKKAISEDYRVRNYQRSIINKNCPYMFKYQQFLYFVGLDENNRVKIAYRSNEDGSNLTMVNAPQVQQLIDTDNIKLIKRNAETKNPTVSNTKTSNPTQAQQNKGANAAAQQAQNTNAAVTSANATQQGNQILGNANESQTLQTWDKLPLYGTPNSRLAFIQKALGIVPADGKLGPQTVGMIFQKMAQTPITINGITINPMDLQKASWQPGRNGKMI